MGIHFCRFEWIKMGRQSDQVERAACGSGKSINFYQIGRMQRMLQP